MAKAKARKRSKRPGARAARLAAETARLRAAERDRAEPASPEQAALREALAGAGMGEPSIESPDAQLRAAAEARREMEVDSTLNSLATTLADRIAKRLRVSLPPQVVNVLETPLDRIPAAPGRPARSLDPIAAGFVGTDKAPGSGAAFHGDHFNVELMTSRRHDRAGLDVEGPSIGVTRSDGSADRNPPLLRALNILGDVTDRLDQQVTFLQGRLTPVLPSKPEDVPGGGTTAGRPMVGTSNVVRHIEGVSERLGVILARLTVLSQEVEV